MLEKRLPPYMVPRIVISVQSLPLSSSAKVDRKQVVAWLERMSARETDSIDDHDEEEPMTAPIDSQDLTARQINAKLVEILEVKATGLNGTLPGHDVFLTAIGIDSVQYIQLSMFIHRNYGVNIPLAKLIGHRTTIRELAQYIDNTHQQRLSKVRRFFRKGPA